MERGPDPGSGGRIAGAMPVGLHFTHAQPRRPTQRASLRPRAKAASQPVIGMSGLGFLPDIQGIRAIAVLLVVLYHTGVPGVSGGYIGVDVFFVISGYLISGLLITERHRTGTIAFGEFYARRARRLLPAAFLTILASIVISRLLLAPFEQRETAGSALSAALYVSNIRFAVLATDYLAGESQLDPLLHTWSLAVEEQFYLVWPGLIFVAAFGIAALRIRHRLTLVLCVVVAVSLAASVWLTRSNQPWAFFGTGTRAWQFGLGALTFLLLWNRTEIPRAVREASGWIGLVLIGWAATTLNHESAFPGSIALIPSVGTVLLLCGGRGTVPATPSRFLSTRGFVWLGDLSYSWYLWHWPALVAADIVVGAEPRWAKGAAAVAALAVAQLSYRWVENPIRYSRALTAGPRPGLRLAFVMTMAGVAAALVADAVAKRDMRLPQQLAYSAAEDDIPILYQRGCHTLFRGVDSRACVFGSQESSRAIVLLGDSHAAHWFPALEAVAAQTGSRLVTLTKSACPAMAVTVYIGALKRVYRECGAWREAMLKRIETLRPELVVISSAYRYRTVDANGQPTAIDPADWGLGLDSVLRHLHTAAIPVLVIHDTPWPKKDVRACLARAAWRRMTHDVCNFDQSADRVIQAPRLAAEVASVGRWDNAFSLDATPAICEGDICRVEVGQMVRYRDSNHLTVAFSRSLAPLIIDRLRAHAAADPRSRVGALFDNQR